MKDSTETFSELPSSIFELKLIENDGDVYFVLETEQKELGKQGSLTRGRSGFSYQLRRQSKRSTGKQGSLTRGTRSGLATSYGCSHYFDDQTRGQITVLQEWFGTYDVELDGQWIFHGNKHMQ